MTYLPNKGSHRYAFDTFHRANSLAGLGTADSGQTWLDTSFGGWEIGINNDQVYVPMVGGGGAAQSVLDSGAYNGLYNRIRVVAGGGVGVFNNSDAATLNYYYLFFTGINTWTIAKFVNPINTVLATGLGSAKLGDEFALSRLDKTLTYWLNDKAVASVDDGGVLLNNTFFGIFINSGVGRASHYNLRTM